MELVVTASVQSFPSVTPATRPPLSESRVGLFKFLPSFASNTCMQ